MKIALNLEELSNDDLSSLRVQIDKEFKKRKIKFSAGDVGEYLVIKYFNDTPGLSNLQKAPTGTKNVDALSRNGERYSIKTIKDGSKTGTIYPDKDDPDKELFEFIVIVFINDDYEINALYRFNWKQFKQVRQWDKTMNAWYISKSSTRLKQGECLYERNKRN